MKTAARLVAIAFLLCSPLMAQLPTDSPVDVLRHPSWNKGVYLGGGTSVGSNPSAQSMVFGLRIGRVLTSEIGHGVLRGSFEMAGDIIPIHEFWRNGGRYTGGLNPIILKWNFTNGCKVAPYVAAVGGVLFSPANFPPGDTSQVNFTTGPEIGVQWFRKENNSINLAVKAFHLSNASIGRQNPGINASLLFIVGYTWH